MSSSKNLELDKTGFLSKSNSAFIEQMYLQYINRDPGLPDGWKNYFEATLFNLEGLPASSFYIKELIK